jgi:hypothetical protein
VSATAYDDAHLEDGSSAPNASAASDPISVTVTGSDIDPSKLGITVTKSTVAASADVPGANKGDLWNQYDRDPGAAGAALIASWWWDSTQWVALPVAIYLDQLAARDIQADSAVMGLIAAGIITGGLFQTSDTNPRSWFDTAGFHSADADGATTFDTANGNVQMINATATNMTVTKLNAVGGSISLLPEGEHTPVELYAKTFDSAADLTGWDVSSGSLTVSSEQAHSGTTSMKVDSDTGSAYLYLQQAISPSLLSGGATYTFDYWVYSPVANELAFDLIVWNSQLPAFSFGFETRPAGWSHLTRTIDIPYSQEIDATTNYKPYLQVGGILDSDTGKYVPLHIDDVTVTRTPFGAGSYYGPGDDGYPKLEMYGDDGSTLVSIKASDDGETGGKVVFATRNGIFLGTEAAQPQLAITDSGVGVSSSGRIDLNAYNDGVYANNHRIGYDTGWVDIRSQMTGLPSGASYKTMYARVINDMCIVAGRIEGISANQGNPYGAGTIPAAYRPASNSPIIGGAANPGGGAFLSPSGAINCRNLYPGNITWTEFSIGPYPLT